jgi:hypothetical protein
MTVTTNQDTHPCLRERLEQIGGEHGPGLRGALLPIGPTESAASALLGDAAKAIRQELNKSWQTDCGERWSRKHDRAISLDHRIQWVSESMCRTPDAEALWEKARAIIDLQSDKAAEGLLREILSIDPAHAPARFCLGRHLLSEGRAEGVTEIERSMAQDESLRREGHGVLFDFYRRRGEAAKLEEIRRRVDEHNEMTRVQRETVTSGDEVTEHGLPSEQIRALTGILESFPELEKAYLGRKVNKTEIPKPLFLLCVRASQTWYGFPKTEIEENIASKLMMKVTLPGRTVTFAASGPLKSIGKNLVRTRGTLIFARSRTRSGTTHS